MDSIFIENLEVACVIGDLPEERIREQRIFVSAVMSCRLEKVCASDRLEDTVNYVAAADEIRKALQHGRFRMIERAAAAAATVCLGFAGVEEVQITIRKPEALTGGIAGVTISRRNG